jgi:7-cyano-7-deazaguanine synthase
MSKGAIVLLSGGLDSTVCLFEAAQSGGFDEIHAVSFSYYQRHKVELIYAEKMAKAAGITTHKTIEVPCLPGWSALTHGGSLNAKTSRNPSLPASFVPGRNLMFVTLAAMYGYNRGLDTVVIGANQVDYSGYPDCRETALAAMEIAVGEAFEWSEFALLAPLLNLSKAMIWARADALGILEMVRTQTVSCYKGAQEENPWGRGCGECPACELRAAGWYEFVKLRARGDYELTKGLG